MTGLLESSAFGAALLLGFRHGFDWDHLAALTDLTGSQAHARRSMWLATLYALGHAAMVLVLGGAAIVFAEQLPTAADAVVERLVGASLVALGLWIAFTAARTKGAPPVRSRWMLLIGAVRRIRSRGGRREQPVVIEHAHPHDHTHLHAHSHSQIDPERSRPLDTARAPVVVAHRHLHRHVVVPPVDPFVAYGSWSSFGVGLLHGIGAETPTQVLVFATAVQSSGRPASVGLLLCFVVGLVLANTLVAATSTFGFARALRYRAVLGAVAAATATFSIVVGTLLLLGEAAALPPVLDG